MDKYQHSAKLLEKLELALKSHGHWQETSPSDKALASVEPFAVDTMFCQEWLQWIFIPKMNQLVIAQHPLPTNFSISPYVEEAMKGMSGADDIYRITLEFDNLMKS